MSEAKNVYEAILLVMKEVGYIQKDGEIKKGANYTYTSESAFIAALRPVMIEHGLVFHPAANTYEYTNYTYDTKAGSTMNMVVGKFGFKIVHAPSQTEIFVATMGMGADSGDKAVGKAMTNAMKYALRQSFMIETGDDPDHTPSVEQERLDISEESYPSKTMTKEEKGAWLHVVKKAMKEGKTLDEAIMLADDKYYAYVEAKENK